MFLNEVKCKSILNKSGISVIDYAINPYYGCAHKCQYCYAVFMKKFTGHTEPWGDFVDVKVNAPEVLARQLTRLKKRSRISFGTVCDPYQPLELKYQITRQCLEILLGYDWPATIQTKSSLVYRDINLIEQFSDIRVGLSITTGDEKVREIFEPNAPSITDRLETLKKLHSQGVETFVMIAPLLLKAEELIPKLEGYTDNVLVDRMNYHYADRIYKKYNLTSSMTEGFFLEKKRELTNILNKRKMEFQFLY